MNEEALKSIYNDMGFESQGVSYEDFIGTMSESEEARKSVYNDMGFEGQEISYDSYEETLGFKKKAQEEEVSSEVQPKVQEPTESESETGFSGFQEWGDSEKSVSGQGFQVTEEGVSKVEGEKELPSTEDFYEKPFEEVQKYIDEKISDPNLDKTDVDELTSQLMEEIPEEMLDSYVQNTVEDRAEQEVRKEFGKNVEEAKKSLPMDVDYSANTLEEVIDNLPEDLLDTVDSDILTQAVSEKREEAFSNLANQALYDKYNEYRKSFEAKGELFPKDLAKDQLADEMIGKELSLLGLSKEELSKYKDAVTELDELRRNPVTPMNKGYQEYISRVRELDGVVSELRELSNRQFMNPETGEINEEAKNQADKEAAEVVQDYKNDYQKLKTALDTEVAKQDYLESRLREITGKEDVNIRELVESTDNNMLTNASSEDVLTADVFFDSNKEDQISSLLREYNNSLSQSKVLSRALLLNEDVTSTSKGFEMLDGTNLDWLGKGVASATETFYEGLTDKDYLSENDYASVINDIANKEGVELTGQQIKRAEKDLSQKIGEATGSSLAIGADILLTRNILKSASGFITLPSKLAKMKYLKEAFTEGTKLNKAFNYAGELVLEDLAFQLASDDLGVGMGSAEKLSEDAFEKLAARLAGGKLGKFTKLFDNYITRVARKTTARTVGGTVSEYAGDFVNQGIKDGFFTEQQFKDVFGEGDEAVEKLIITASISGGIGLPSTFVSSIKKKYSEDSENGKLIRTYEEAQKLKEKQEKGELTEADLEVLTAEREKAEAEEIAATQEQEVTPQGEVTEETEVEAAPEAETTPEVEVAPEAAVEKKVEPEVEADTFTEEELETPEVEGTLKEEQKKVKNISKAIKSVAPGVEFVFHKTSESYNNSSDVDVSDSRGYRDGNKIHIDLTSVKDNTSFHEAIHPVLDAVFEKSPETYSKLVESMKTDPDFQSYFEAAKEKYESENTQVNEALTEMVSDVASGKYKEGSTVYQKVKDFVKEILTKLGLRESDFNIDLNKEVDVRQFAETIGKALAKGKKITFEQEGKLVQEKLADAISKGGSALVEVSKSAFEATKGKLSDVATKAYEAVNGTAKITQEGFTKALKTSKEFAAEVSNILKKGKDVSVDAVGKIKKAASQVKISALEATVKKGDSFYERVNKTKDITLDGIEKAKNSAKKVISNSVSVISKSLDSKAKDLYESINNSKKITSEGLSKAIEESSEFANAVLNSLSETGSNALKGSVDFLAKNYSKSVDSVLKTAKSLGVSAVKAKQIVSEAIKEQGKQLSKVKNTISKNLSKKDVESISKEEGVSEEEVEDVVLEKVADKKYKAKGDSTLAKVVKKIRNTLAALALSGSLIVGGSSFSTNTDGSVSFSIENAVTNLLPKTQAEWAIRALEKYSIIETTKEEEIVDVVEAPKVEPVKKEVEKKAEKPKVQTYFQVIGKVRDTRSLDGDSLLSYRSQWDNKNGFDYYPVPVKKDLTPGFQLEGVVGVGHFMLDASPHPTKQYSSPVNRPSSGGKYTPAFERLPDGKVRVRYKTRSELTKDDILLSPLRQWNYSDIDFARLGRPLGSGFPSNVQAIYTKQGKGTHLMIQSGNRNAYGRMSGGSVVFIWHDANGNRIIRDFAGNINSIENEGINITEAYGLKEGELVLGIHDAASFNAKPAAKDGVLKAEQWSGYHNSGTTGGALVIPAFKPPQGIAFQKKGKKDTTIKKENQAKFKKDIDAAVSKLSEAQRKTARGLLVNVKDAKTLEIARAKLRNLVKTGAAKPKTSTIVTAKGDKTFKVESDKAVNKALLKAEAEGAKGLSKAQKEMVKGFKDKIKSLGSQTQATINSIARRLVNIDPANPKDVLEFNDYLDKLKKDSDYRAKRAEAKNTKAKLKKALVAARKKYGNKLGVRGQVAETFAKMNLSRISDIEAATRAMEQMIESFNNPASFELIKKEADNIISEHRKAKEAFDTKRSEMEEEALKSEYETSPMKDAVSFEQFKQIKADALAKEKSDARIEKEIELKDKMKEYLGSRIDYIKNNFDSITKGLSNIERAAIKDLIKSSDLLFRLDLLSPSNLLSMHNAIDEVITYNSASGTATISNILKAIKKSKKAEIVGKGKMDRGIFGRSKKLGNLSTYAKAITQDQDTALKLSSILFGDYNRSFQKVKQKTEAFLEKRSELREKLGIKRPESARIGIISRLLQSEPGSTSEEIKEDIKTKVESIKNQIEKLRKQKRKRFQREADFLQEAFDTLDLNNIDYKGSTEQVIKNLESKLKPNEKEFLDFLEEEFAKVRPDLENSYRVNKGAEINPVDRYLPTSSYRLGTKAEPEEFVTRESLNVTPSGRTITRKRPNPNVMYNYDILGVTEQGYSDIMNDIHTLGDREVLTETTKSNPVRDLFIGKDTGKEEYKMYDALVDRVSVLMQKRNKNHDTNSLRASRLAKLGKDVFNSILAAPLRKTDQVVRQTFPILVNTMAENAPATTKAFGYMSSTLGSKKNRENLKKLFKNANTDIRILNGDASMGDIAGLNEKAVRYIMKQTEAGRKIDKKYLSKIGSGALGWADQMAAGGSWLAFYIEARTKQEGKGFKFNLEQEANNPNKTAIDNANTKSDWINNKSDVTTDGGALELKGLPNAAKPVKDLLFLFKSFAMNASYRTALDARNFAKGLARGDAKTTLESSRSILATVGGMVMFELLKENFLSPLYDDIVEEVLGAEDPDPEKEVLDPESWAEGMPGAVAKALMDLFTGWTPDGTDVGIKKLLNALALDAAKEEYDEKKQFNDLAGIPTPKFDPYSEKLFYDQYNGPGSVNRFMSVGEDLFEDYGILSGDETFSRKLDHLTLEEEYDFYSKFLTAIHATSVLTGNADAEILTKKYKRNKKKEKEKK